MACGVPVDHGRPRRGRRDRRRRRVHGRRTDAGSARGGDPTRAQRRACARARARRRWSVSQLFRLDSTAHGTLERDAAAWSADADDRRRPGRPAAADRGRARRGPADAEGDGSAFRPLRRDLLLDGLPGCREGVEEPPTHGANYACIHGRISVVLHDDRDGSPTRGRTIELELVARRGLCARRDPSAASGTASRGSASRSLDPGELRDRAERPRRARAARRRRPADPVPWAGP